MVAQARQMCTTYGFSEIKLKAGVLDPPGEIATLKALNAQDAGASAVILFNEGQPGRTDFIIPIGDATGLTLNTGFTVRGMDLAVGSAVAAADAIHEALEVKDTTSAGLAAYREKLFAGFTGKDMQTYAKAPHFLERPRMYKEYGELIADVLYDVFNHDLTPRRHLQQIVRARFKGSPLKLRDVIGGAPGRAPCGGTRGQTGQRE